MTNITYNFEEIRKKYLTEKDLCEVLSVLFPNCEIVHNKKIKNLGFRPDYYIPSEKIIVEFNGFGHYTSNKIVERDYQKRKIATYHNIKTISIPYFVQLDSRMIQYYFGKESNNYNDYPLGFIDKKALLPGQFSSLGLKRFILEYKSFRKYEKGEKIIIPILLSLVEKYIEGKNTFFECLPFFIDETIRNDMLYGLYEFISEKEVQYLKKNIELSLKLIDSEELYC